MKIDEKTVIAIDTTNRILQQYSTNDLVETANYDTEMNTWNLVVYRLLNIRYGSYRKKSLFLASYYELENEPSITAEILLVASDSRSINPKPAIDLYKKVHLERLGQQKELLSFSAGRYISDQTGKRYFDPSVYPLYYYERKLGIRPRETTAVEVIKQDYFRKLDKVETVAVINRSLELRKEYQESLLQRELHQSSQLNERHRANDSISQEEIDSLLSKL